MYALNRVKIIGYITEKPEIRQVGSGMSVCDANIRTVSKVKRGDEFTSISAFHTVTFWGRTAENIGQYTDAGSQIYVEGRLKTDSWDGEDGKKRYKTKIIADDMLLLTPQNGAYPALQSAEISSGINTVEIIGNLTKDLEVRQTPTGKTVGSTSVATNRKWRDKNTQEFKEEVEFHNLVVWENLAAEGQELLKKGRKVYIEGRVQTRSWDSPEGEKKYTTEVVVEKISLLGHEIPSDASTSSYSAAAPVAAAAAAPVVADTMDSPEIPSIQYESDIKPEDLPF